MARSRSLSPSRSLQSQLICGAVARVLHVGQFPLLGSVPKILLTVAGRSSVSVAIRRTMWICRLSSLEVVGLDLLRRLLPAVVCRRFARIVFLRTARKRWWSSVVYGCTVEVSRLRDAARASLLAHSLQRMPDWDGIQSTSNLRLWCCDGTMFVGIGRCVVRWSVWVATVARGLAVWLRR